MRVVTNVLLLLSDLDCMYTIILTVWMINNGYSANGYILILMMLIYLGSLVLGNRQRFQVGAKISEAFEDCPEFFRISIKVVESPKKNYVGEW